MKNIGYLSILIVFIISILSCSENNNKNNSSINNLTPIISISSNIINTNHLYSGQKIILTFEVQNINVAPSDQKIYVNFFQPTGWLYAESSCTIKVGTDNCILTAITPITNSDTAVPYEINIIGDATNSIPLSKNSISGNLINSPIITMTRTPSTKIIPVNQPITLKFDLESNGISIIPKQLLIPDIPNIGWDTSPTSCVVWTESPSCSMTITPNIDADKDFAFLVQNNTTEGPHIIMEDNFIYGQTESTAVIDISNIPSNVYVGQIIPVTASLINPVSISTNEIHILQIQVPPGWSSSTTATQCILSEESKECIFNLTVGGSVTGNSVAISFTDQAYVNSVYTPASNLTVKPAEVNTTLSATPIINVLINGVNESRIIMDNKKNAVLTFTLSAAPTPSITDTITIPMESLPPEISPTTGNKCTVNNSGLKGANTCKITLQKNESSGGGSNVITFSGSNGSVSFNHPQMDLDWVTLPPTEENIVIINGQMYNSLSPSTSISCLVSKSKAIFSQPSCAIFLIKDSNNNLNTLTPMTSSIRMFTSNNDNIISFVDLSATSNQITSYKYTIQKNNNHYPVVLLSNTKKITDISEVTINSIEYFNYNKQNYAAISATAVNDNLSNSIMACKVSESGLIMINSCTSIIVPSSSGNQVVVSSMAITGNTLYLTAAEPNAATGSSNYLIESISLANLPNTLGTPTIVQTPLFNTSINTNITSSASTYIDNKLFIAVNSNNGALLQGVENLLQNPTLTSWSGNWKNMVFGTKQQVYLTSTALDVDPTKNYFIMGTYGHGLISGLVKDPTEKITTILMSSKHNVLTYPLIVDLNNPNSTLTNNVILFNNSANYLKFFKN